jgi:hypothetical protein
VRYVLNWGGFAVASFHMTDGETNLHLKLVSSEDCEQRPHETLLAAYRQRYG